MSDPYDLRNARLVDEMQAIYKNARQLKKIESEGAEISVREPYINTEEEGFKTICKIELELSGSNPTQDFADQLEEILFKARSILSDDLKAASEGQGGA